MFFERREIIGFPSGNYRFSLQKSSMTRIITVPLGNEWFTSRKSFVALKDKNHLLPSRALLKKTKVVLQEIICDPRGYHWFQFRISIALSNTIIGFANEIICFPHGKSFVA